MAEFAEKTHTDVSLWDALELREPMEGLAVGAHGYVVGWTGSAYELKINNRTYEVLPHQAKHRERPALDGADADIKKEFGTCPLCEDKTMTVADPYYACCGGQICERCADLLDLHRLSKRKCPLCGKGVEGPSRDSSTEAHAVVCRRRAKKGDARAHFSLAAMEAVLSEEEQARHLLLLVDEGFAEVCGGVLQSTRRGDGVYAGSTPSMRASRRRRGGGRAYAEHAIDAKVSTGCEHRPSTSTARPASTTASCPTDCGGGSWPSNGATPKLH